MFMLRAFYLHDILSEIMIV